MRLAPFLTLQTVKKLVSKKENKHSAPADVEIKSLLFKLSFKNLDKKNLNYIKSKMQMSLSLIPTSGKAERLISIFGKARNCLNKEMC